MSVTIYRGFMFSTKRTIEFGMCDVGGIMFFAKIFELAHSVYEEFIMNSNLKTNYFENEVFVVPLVNAGADYHSPIKLHSLLTVQLVVTKIGTTSFQLCVKFLDESNNPKATVNTTHVFIDKTDLVKTTIPNEVLDVLQKHLV